MLLNKNICRSVATVRALQDKGFHVPLLIMGAPGCAKTTTLKEFAKRENMFFLSLQIGKMMPDDLCGIHTVEKGDSGKHTEYCTPAWYDYAITESKARGQRVLLFLDELTAADPIVQGAALTMISDRILSFRDRIPQDMVIVAAGNYPGQTSAELVPAMANRFVILNCLNSDQDKHEITGGETTFWDKLIRTGSDEDVRNYLGLNEAPSPYSFTKFREYIDKKVFLTEETEGCKSVVVKGRGLQGFSSTRSLTLVTNFVREYLAHWDDDLWIRMAGDTFGFINDPDGEATNKLMGDDFDCHRDEFLKGTEDMRALMDIVKDISKNPSDKELCKELVDVLEAMTDVDDLSLQEISAMAQLSDVLLSAGTTEAKMLNKLILDKFVNV